MIQIPSSIFLQVLKAVFPTARLVSKLINNSEDKSSMTVCNVVFLLLVKSEVSEMEHAVSAQIHSSLPQNVFGGQVRCHCRGMVPMQDPGFVSPQTCAAQRSTFECKFLWTPEVLLMDYEAGLLAETVGHLPSRQGKWHFIFSEP